MTNALTKLTLKGFRSFREIVDLELKPLNVLVAANGSGKSNFISFFRLLGNMAKKDRCVRL
jgi:predicted ATPase